MVGIDAFLQRLDDDVDLKKMKEKRRGGGGSGLPSSSSSGDDYEFDASSSTASSSSSYPSSIVKKIFIAILVVVALLLAHDARTSPPDGRIIGVSSRFVNDFLLWVKVHPGSGAAAFVLVYGACVVFLLPGTPLTLGGGYVYKVSYGWAGGLFMGTAASTLGSLLGSCSAFLLGRHVMRDRVRRWGRRHPLFDAIDLAVSDNGFRIMCLLYLTPILPLGPVSYVCGTTSMPLAKFAMAKVAAVPLMLLYTFIGASTDTFFSVAVSSSYSATTKDGDGNNVDSSGTGGGGTAVDGGGGRRGVGVDEETHGKMVLFGLVLSVVSMSLVSHFVKKELYKTFDKQKREKSDDDNGGEDRQYRRISSSNNAEEHVEMRRRPRGQAGTIDGSRADSTVDEEKG
ncbi:hypothetical protein ACHAW5_007451 [Stephanodiscus triporus]|uniref:VTT domain-containing protein n=1 Tax=Stephanodiscus triporus TaxID=2934178 RepID=A0ABD3NNW2_9STRA